MKSFVGTPDGLDPYKLIDNIVDVSVSDYWVDTYGEMEKLYESNMFSEVILWGGKCHSANIKQHQLFVFEFEHEGTIKKIATNMPVYLMNDDGKTLAQYNPISKS